MIVVRLDNPHIGAGPAIVLAEVSTVAEYLAIACDRDGARDRSLRLWDGSFPIGTRVQWRHLRGTGDGIVSAIASVEP